MSINKGRDTRKISTVFLEVLIQPSLIFYSHHYDIWYYISFRFYHIWHVQVIFWVKLPRAASIDNLVSYHEKPVLLSSECEKHLTEFLSYG